MQAVAEVPHETSLDHRPDPAQQGLEPEPRSPAARHGTRSAGEFLSFKLGAEEYGIDILKVQEIRSYEQPTRIANAPHFVKGVVNLRGVIVPLVDLRLKFGLDQAEYNEFTAVIVLNVARRIVGVVVDSVSDVQQLAAEHIKPVPQFGSLVDDSFIIGFGNIQDRMMILLDIEALIRSAEPGLVVA